jgi:diguanylate cyclase (GGDEF)-like protein
VELEKLAHEKDDEHPPKLSVDVKVERGLAPAAGFERQEEPATQGDDGHSHDYLASMAAARREAQILFELSHDLGGSLRLDDVLSLFSVRLRRLVAYDAMAVYVRHGKELKAEYVSGDNFRLFSSLRIPVGEGLSGWVAHNSKPIVNGNPSVEPGYLNDPTKFSILRSALAVPLQSDSDVIAVLALYRTAQDAFTQDHLRIVLNASSKLGVTIEKALKVRDGEDSGTTDSLTGLPNTRSLYKHLDGELSRCKRSGSPLTVLVLDLNGFKEINDRFGQIEGNNLLRMFAAALKDTCREYDYAARIGGDEFAIVAPGMPAEAVGEMSERLQKTAAEVGNEVCGTHVLTLSVGQASYPADGGDAEALLSAADQSMYKMKRSRPALAKAQGVS